MMISEEQLEELHKKSSNHREDAEKEGSISCFYCIKRSKTKDVKEWIDKQQTALCPKCGIDACIPGRIEKGLLREMYKHWFEREGLK